MGSTSYQSEMNGVGAMTDTTGTTYFTRTPVDEYTTNTDAGDLVDQHLPSGKGYLYLFDGLGSVVGLVDDSGNVVNTYSYDPYGNSIGWL